MQARNGHSWLIWNLANMVSSVRLMTPAILFATNWPIEWKMTAYAVLFATDALDGPIARWTGNCHGIGKFIDSFSDKVCHGSALIFAISIFSGQLGETALFMAIAIGEGFIAILSVYGIYLITKERYRGQTSRKPVQLYSGIRDEIVSGLQVNIFGKAKMISYFMGGAGLAGFLHWPNYGFWLVYWGFFLLGLVFAWLANRMYYLRFAEWQRKYFP